MAAKRGRRREGSHDPDEVTFAKRSLEEGKELGADPLGERKCKCVTDAGSWVPACTLWRTGRLWNVA